MVIEIAGQTAIKKGPDQGWLIGGVLVLVVVVIADS